MNRIVPNLEGLFPAIVDEANMGILVFRESGQSLYFNKLAKSLLEVPGTCSEFTIEKLYQSEGRENLRPFNSEILSHEGLYQDLIVGKLNAQRFIANIAIKKLLLDGESLNLIMIQDITLQKKLQREVMAKQSEIKLAFEELLKQNQQLKELDLAKNRFVALTTHELRTPAAAMFGSAEILKLGLYDGEAELKEFIEIVYDQGQHLLDLINDILDFSKAQGGKMDYFIEEHALSPLLADLVENHKSMAGQTHVEISFTPPTEEVLAYFDDLRLKQVVSNIMSNAIKYNKPEGKVRLWVESDETKATIFVEDTGLGIDKADLQKVFNEFETLGKVATHHKGTGLGMPISKKLIEGMGGEIHLDSTLGVGSKFWIHVPRKKVLPDSFYRPRPNESGDLAA